MEKFASVLLSGLLLVACGGNQARAKRPEAPAAPKEYTYAVRSVHPHPTTSYTQGLQFADGMLWEGTGEHGESVVQTSTSKRAHGGVRTAAAGGFRRRDHAARRQVVPAHVAIEQSLCLRPGNRQENQGVPLSRRRLGTDHRRAEALHVGRHGQYLHARPCDLQTRETHDGDAQRHSDQFPQRTGVDRRQVVGQRLHDRPDRHYRPGDGRWSKGS